MTASVVVKCGTLITGCDPAALTDKSLLIEDGKISEIGTLDAFDQKQDVDVIDAQEHTVMPGMMDLHVHLGAIVDPGEPTTLASMLNTPSPLLTLHGAKNARLMIEAGFTTVRELSGYGYGTGIEMVSLRRAVEMGLVKGPRILASGWVGPTAGHLDLGMPLTWRRRDDETADGKDEVRKLTRQYIRNGVDVLKTATSGGGGGNIEEVWWRNYTVEELEVIVDEAHAVKKTVAVHAHTPDGIKRTIRAGCDTVEHGTTLDQEALDMLVETGTFLVPTCSVSSEKAIAGRMRGGVSEHVLKKHKATVRIKEENFRKAHEAGVRIACGTDTYRSLREHMGESAYELELMVKYGMTPMEAIVAATKTAAEAIHLSEDLGTLETGKLADLLVIDGDPLRDITLLQDLQRILVVMKAGVINVDRRNKS